MPTRTISAPSPICGRGCKAPVYATPFTASVLRRKLREAGLLDAVPITEIPLGGKFKLRPFELELITLTHSIPEPNALAIRTQLGTVLHTGDWKIDPEPLLGEVDRRGERCGASATRACWPWSATAPTSSSTARRAPRRRCAPTSRSWSKTAQGPGRGRLLRLQRGAGGERRAWPRSRPGAIRCWSAGRCSAWSRRRRRCGYLLDFPPCVAEQRGRLPAARQGAVHLHRQPGRAARLDGRIANGEHRDLVLEAGDTAIFSSRVIPGNERAIGASAERACRRAASR